MESRISMTNTLHNKDVIIQQLLFDKDQLSMDLAKMTRKCDVQKEDIHHLVTALDQEIQMNSKLLAQIQRLMAKLGSHKEELQKTKSLYDEANKLKALILDLDFDQDNSDSDDQQSPSLLDSSAICYVSDPECNIQEIHQPTGDGKAKDVDIEHTTDTKEPEQIQKEPKRKSSGWFGRSSSKKRKKKKGNSELKTLAESLAAEVADKEAQIIHLNKVKQILANRVQELEDMYKEKETEAFVLDKRLSVEMTDDTRRLSVSDHEITEDVVDIEIESGSIGLVVS